MHYIDEDIQLPYSELELPLVHATKKFEILCKILDEGLMPSYCTEILSNNDRQLKAAFPMVSLSNLDATVAHHQMRSYGTFQIALKKSWGQRHNFNPVLYLDRHSTYTRDLINGFDRLKDLGVGELLSAYEGDATGDRHQLAKLLLQTYSHAKNYDGPLVRQKTLWVDPYHFGLEREWRLLFRKAGVKPYLLPAELEEIDTYNKVIENERIPIELGDIASVTVELDHQQEKAEEILIKRFGSADVKFLRNEVRLKWDE
jgi:hypothetical protein